MNILALIPARMGSSRFPGKPLASINGKSMIEHVYTNTASCSLLSDTYIATCDQEIMQAASGFNAKSVLTSNSHERASDRCCEALSHVEALTGKHYEIIVMVQGDEPLITTSMIESSVQPLLNDPSIMVTNLMGPIHSYDELLNPNCIKVVTDSYQNALYFSRLPLPYAQSFNSSLCGKQVCVIPFRRKALQDFSALPPSKLEISESIDMLRFLHHGYKVNMVPVSDTTCPVDVPEDIKLVESLMQHK